MKYIKLALLLIVSLISCKNKTYTPRIISSVNVKEYILDSSSVRAIEVLKDSSMIFATDKGYIGFASKNNISLLDQIVYDSIVPHFRAIASNGESSFALSIGNPALLYKFENGEYKLVYKEEHEKVFYDAIQFFNINEGIAMGDPTEDCLSIILTNDAGNSWHKIPCDQLPKTENGEAAFAASNTNIAIFGNNAWIVTGGKRARVFHTPDKGMSWNVYNTPIIAGNSMTGIFSVDFYDNKNGIIIGGDWQNKDRNTRNKAITKDGGKTWQLIADGKEPNYKSCIQYVPETSGKELFAVGTTGISFSDDNGKTWSKVSNQEFYTIKFVNKNIAWLAGKNKIGKLILN